MWADLLKQLPKFSNPVLTWVDAAGFPFSVRCVLELDASNRRFKINLSDDIPFQAGPASLLWHSHNEQLWDLKSMTACGRLKKVGRDWWFVPLSLIAVSGLRGPLDQLRTVFKGRRRANAYLEKRGLSRPEISWAAIKVLWDEAKEAMDIHT